MHKNYRIRLEIVEELNQLLKKKTIEDITVTELCETVGISRTTFYSYFNDIYSIGEWFWHYGAEQILGKMGEDYGIYEGFRQLFEFLYENRNKSGRVIPARSRNSIPVYADQQSLKLHIRQIEKLRGYPLDKDERLAMQYTSSANAVMTAKWIQDGMVVAPGKMADLMTAIQPSFAIEALGK